MPTRCQDCNSHFLLDATTVAQGIGCPDCGGTRLERDQPSPTHSDGEVRNMVDPATQLDQGGNPLQEGVWAGVDGGWQPAYKRDESFASVRTAGFAPSGIEPQVHGTVTPGELGIHNGNLKWLAMLDASINGKPVRENWERLFTEHGLAHMPNFRSPVTVSVHHPEHLPSAIELIESPHVIGDPASLVHAPIFSALGSAMKRNQAPCPPGLQPLPEYATPQPQVMSNQYSRALSQEPYLPWYHQADVQRYPGDGGAPVSLTNDEWASDKRQRYLDRNTGGHRLNWKPGTAGRGIMIGPGLHTWPVNRTMDDPQGGMMHGEYLNALGINPASVDVNSGFEINPDGSSDRLPPEAPQIDPNLRAQVPQDDFAAFASVQKEGIAPLLALGGRVLLGQAIGGLMKKAIGGAGNFLDTGGAPPENPYGGAPAVSLVASEHTSVGVAAPVESPGSTPRIVEDHDPEAVDQQEFNDGDTSPAFNNPNKDNADAGMARSVGEDGVNQKLEFRHDGDAVSQAEMLLPLIMQHVNSEHSGLNNPQLKALHEALEQEIPGYLDHADENDESVHKLMEQLRNPEGVTAATHQGAPVYQGTPIPQAQMQMGQGQMAMPGTHQNPIQPGGMPVSGRCTNCGGVVNADGSCPQCGAAAGANQQGNMQAAPGGEQMNPPGFMRPAMGHTAADHQGPITPQQKEVFAQYLIEQGRNEEVATMMGNPGLYADEWAQYLNKSTQPPEVDPTQQAPQPQMPPEQMGQMPVPGMSIPQPTASSDNPRRCPSCSSATTSLLNDDGELRCHRCGNIWTADIAKEKISKRAWVVTSIPDTLNNDSPNPVAAPAADQVAPGDRENQQDSTLSWADTGGTPLQVGQTYEMHSSYSPIPDVVKVDQVKPDSVVLTMVGEYNSPSDPTDANGPGYQHEIDLHEAQAQNLTFNPTGDEGDQEQSQDQTQQDGIGQTVNTEPTRQSPEVPYHAKTADLNADVPADGICKVCGNPLTSTEHLHGCSAAKLAAERLSWGYKQVDQDPRGQLQIGQEVSYNSFDGRVEQGTIVGFQPGLAQDPLIQNKRMGDVKIISRGQVIPSTSVQSVPQPQPQSVAASVSTDECPKCQYGHVTSSYNSPTEIQYECFRCAHQWKVADLDEDNELNPDSRAWLEEDDGPNDFNFDRVQGIEAALGSKGRNIRDIAAKDPRNGEIRERLNKNAGAKFSPREQKEFIDEDGVARNADRLNLDGTHYVESAFDNSKARPDRVNDAYLGLGL